MKKAAPEGGLRIILQEPQSRHKFALVELHIPHAGVAPACSQQLVMHATLNDASAVHDQNFMRLNHGGQAVRNDQRCLALRSAAQLILNSGAEYCRLMLSTVFTRDKSILASRIDAE